MHRINWSSNRPLIVTAKRGGKNCEISIYKFVDIYYSVGEKTQFWTAEANFSLW